MAHVLFLSTFRSLVPLNSVWELTSSFSSLFTPIPILPEQLVTGYGTQNICFLHCNKLSRK